MERDFGARIICLELNISLRQELRGWNRGKYRCHIPAPALSKERIEAGFASQRLRERLRNLVGSQRLGTSGLKSAIQVSACAFESERSREANDFVACGGRPAQGASGFGRERIGSIVVSQRSRVRSRKPVASQRSGAFGAAASLGANISLSKEG